MNSPFWALGFRPFFLFGSLLSIAAIAYWIGILFLGLPYRGYWDPPTWHAHEMIYGFSAAIVAGFALTAIQNWTGKRGPHGFKLQSAFGIWLIARVLLAFVSGPNLWVTAVDLLFFPVLAALLFPYLKDPELKIERVFFVYFGLFFLGNLLVHFELHGLVSGYSRKGLHLGVNTLVTLIVFMGGRVIPFFTESSIARAQPKTFKPIEILSHVTTWLFLLTQFFYPISALSGGVALFASIVHLIRLRGWYVRRIRKVPIIWVLHLAYFWIAAGYALSGFASLALIASSPSLHALTVGGIGVLIYGMITRVSLGHTGRKLIPSLAVVIGYGALAVAAVVRVLLPLLSSSYYSVAVVLSALLWILAFGIFFFSYWPVLTQPRIDKKPG